MRKSSEMWQVGFYLSKFGSRLGTGAPLPPAALQVTEWNRAYAMFYRELGDGRTLSSFANSLKNARDTFDAHLESGRVGWRRDTAAREPAKLPQAAARVLRLWGEHTESEVWGFLSQYTDTEVAGVSDDTLSNLFAEIEPDAHTMRVRTEGGRRAVVTNRIERDPSLRDAALRIHGVKCQVCGFSFEVVYGAWGRGFAIVHHLRMLADDLASERATDPRIDLAVLCANCHCMVHRRRKVVLTLDELSAKLIRSAETPR